MPSKSARSLCGFCCSVVWLRPERTACSRSPPSALSSAPCTTPAAPSVVGAQISLLNTGTSATRAAVTDDDGNYAFRNIDVGSYKVTIAASASRVRRYRRSRSPLAKPAASTPCSSPPAIRRPSSCSIHSAAPVITTDVSNLVRNQSRRRARQPSRCHLLAFHRLHQSHLHAHPLRQACRPTTPASSPSCGHHRRAPQRHHRRHLIRRRRILRPRQ